MSTISIEKYKYQRATIINYLVELGIKTHKHSEDIEKLKEDRKKRQLEALGIYNIKILCNEQRVKTPAFFIWITIITSFLSIVSVIAMIADIVFSFTDLYSTIYIIWSLSWFSLLITNIIATKEWKRKNGQK